MNIFSRKKKPLIRIISVQSNADRLDIILCLINGIMNESDAIPGSVKCHM